MAYVPKPNTGTLFNVKEKRGNNWPDIRGDIFASRDLLKSLLNQDGDLIKISVSAWRKESEKGTKFLSLQIGEPYEKKESRPEVDPEDIPF